jgi:hypothetical protein
MLKKVLINFIKVATAAGLLWWLVNSGKLDWSLLRTLTSEPLRLVLAIVLCATNLLLCTWRWRLLLSARTKDLMASSKLFLVNWVGMFFSSALPGSVTGDVIKIFYVRQQSNELSKPFLLFSCLVDRVMGLVGLILLIGLNTAFNYQSLIALSPQLKPLLKFNFLALAGLSIGLIAYFFFPQYIQRALEFFVKRFSTAQWPVRLSELWRDFADARPQMLKCILISLVVQTIGAGIFHLLATPYYSSPMALSNVLSFIPLGFIAVAIPIAPGGLGVGHAAFQSLFAMVGENGGANFFNFYFVVTIGFNLLGIIPWLILKRPTASARE